MRFTKPRLTPSFAPLIVLAIALSGCDPVINVAGANFPSWLFCAICGALITAILRPVLVATGIEPFLWPLPLVYPCLMILIGCIMWLIFFNRL